MDDAPTVIDLPPRTPARPAGRPPEVIVDRWGIPHIYAASRHDLFFAQGWNAARDRLWQLDLWRKRGLGRLSENFGPAYVAQDRAARLFLYRGDLDAEWAAYGADARSWSAAFVAGINARVDQVVLAGEAALPVEFAAHRLASRRAGRWRTWCASAATKPQQQRCESEALRARVTAASGGQSLKRTGCGAGSSAIMSRWSSPRRPRPDRLAGRPDRRLRPGDQGGDLRARCRAERHGCAGRDPRLQQLGHRRLAHGERPADSGQRSAQGAERALDPLRRPP